MVKFHTGGYSPQTHRLRRQVCLAGVIPAPTVELSRAEFRKFASQISAHSFQYDFEKNALQSGWERITFLCLL